MTFGQCRPLLDPLRDQRLIGAGIAAKLRGLPPQRLIRLALGEAFEEPGHLGQQVGPPGRQLAQRGHRRVMLAGGQRAPAGVMPGRAGQLRRQDLVSRAHAVTRIPFNSPGTW